MVIEMDMCDSSVILYTVYVIKTMAFIILIVAVIFLMISLTARCIKAIITDANIPNLLKDMSKKIIATLILFFIPSIINFSLDLIEENGHEQYTACVTNANLEYIKERREQEELAKQAEKEQEEQLMKQKIKEAEEKRNNSSGNTIIPRPDPIQTENYATEIKYYSQIIPGVNFCNPGHSMGGYACGPTSLAMIIATFTNPAYTPTDMRNYICNKQGTIPHTEGSGLAHVAFTNAKMLSDYNLNVETLFDYGSLKAYNDADGAKVLASVQAGKGVIVNVPGHYVVLGPNPSCSKNEVYLYDPAQSSVGGVGGESYNDCYTVKEAIRRTGTRHNRCVNGRGQCGWSSAWAYSGK